MFFTSIFTAVYIESGQYYRQFLYKTIFDPKTRGLSSRAVSSQERVIMARVWQIESDCFESRFRADTFHFSCRKKPYLLFLGRNVMQCCPKVWGKRQYIYQRNPHLQYIAVHFLQLKPNYFKKQSSSLSFLLN